MLDQFRYLQPFLWGQVCGYYIAERLFVTLRGHPFVFPTEVSYHFPPPYHDFV